MGPRRSRPPDDKPPFATTPTPRESKPMPTPRTPKTKPLPCRRCGAVAHLPPDLTATCASCGEVLIAGITPDPNACRLCGKAQHPLATPETPHAIMVGTWIVEPAAGNEGPGGPWCIHSALAHRPDYHEWDARAGRAYTRTGALRDARLMVRPNV